MNISFVTAPTYYQNFGGKYCANSFFKLRSMIILIYDSICFYSWYNLLVDVPLAFFTGILTAICGWATERA